MTSGTTERPRSPRAIRSPEAIGVGRRATGSGRGRPSPTSSTCAPPSPRWRLAPTATRGASRSWRQRGTTGWRRRWPTTVGRHRGEGAAGRGRRPSAGRGAGPSGTACGGVWQATTRTAPDYALHLVADDPPRPGLLRVAGPGAAIEVDVWALPPHGWSRFVAAGGAGLAVGRVALADGRVLPGFVAPPTRWPGARTSPRTAGGGPGGQPARRVEPAAAGRPVGAVGPVGQGPRSPRT